MKERWHVTRTVSPNKHIRFKTITITEHNKLMIEKNDEIWELKSKLDKIYKLMEGK